MKFEYQNKPIDWDNAGITPPQDLIEKGFQPGYKPPAEYFNAILHNTFESIKEIQEKTIELADAAGGGTVGSTIIDVTCTYTAPDTEAGTSGEYTIATDVDLQSEDYFCLRFVAPNDYVKDTAFTIGSESYTAVNAGFKENDLVILNFDVSQQKCFFVSGGGVGDSDTITAKVICAGNGEEHKGGIYIGDSPTSYGNADEMLNDSIVIGTADNISGENSIVSGQKNNCTGTQCLVLGKSNTVQNNYIIVSGTSNNISGKGSIGGGASNTLKAANSFVCGLYNTVNGSSLVHGIICGGSYNTVDDNTSYSIVSGQGNNSSGSCSIVTGGDNEVKGSNNIVTGYKNAIKGNYNAIFGIGCTNYTDGGFTAEYAFMAGIGNKVLTETNSGGELSTVFGFGNIGKAINLVCGIFCKTPNPTSDPYFGTATRGDLFVIGNGTGTRDIGYNVTATTRSNAFRVACDGGVYGTKSYTASGADYAEMFEWADGNPDNEDRRGLFVTLNGEKIRPASAEDDYILGVVSATPSVVADAQTDDWGKKWKTDIFGERLLDENGAWILNENFREEENESYISRLDRKEWAAVGLVGKLILIDDGTCEVNGYCSPTNGGIATKSQSGYRVLSRVDENHIKVLIK